MRPGEVVVHEVKGYSLLTERAHLFDSRHRTEYNRRTRTQCGYEKQHPGTLADLTEGLLSGRLRPVLVMQAREKASRRAMDYKEVRSKSTNADCQW